MDGEKARSSAAHQRFTCGVSFDSPHRCLDRDGTTANETAQGDEELIRLAARVRGQRWLGSASNDLAGPRMSPFGDATRVRPRIGHMLEARAGVGKRA